jgi:hypothetical protein
VICRNAGRPFVPTTFTEAVSPSFQATQQHLEKPLKTLSKSEIQTVSGGAAQILWEDPTAAGEPEICEPPLIIDPPWPLKP